MRSILSSLALATFLSSNSFAQNSMTSFKQPKAYSISGKFSETVRGGGSNSQNSSYESVLCSYRMILIHENEYKMVNCGDYKVALFYLTLVGQQPTVRRTLFTTKSDYISIDAKQLDTYRYDVKLNIMYENKSKIIKSCPMKKTINVLEDKFYAGCESQFVVRLFYSQDYGRPLAMIYQSPQEFSNADLFGHELLEIRTISDNSQQNLKMFSNQHFEN